jgi:SET domain
MLNVPLDEYLRVASIMLKINRIVALNSKIMDCYNANEHPAEKLPGPELLGNGLFLASSLLNHSCDPNMYQVSYGTSVVFRAARPIMKGDQLTTCYNNMPAIHYSYAVRQDALSSFYKFVCR